ncbi:hypothetical protein B0J14DRAFT_661639 [Halenospora varia]|nr:hypothetical protein B0J14DRAFT_661639 [Halenospora varia]
MGQPSMKVALYGTNPEYIIYLETKVKQLTQACSPPSSPTLVVGDEPIYNPPECAPIPGLRFLPYEPDSLRFVNEFGTPPRSANRPDSLSRLSKRRRKSTARWQNEMDDMLCNILSAKDWPSKRECIGLSSETKLFLAFDTIIGGAIQPTKPAAAESNSLVRFELGDHAIRLVSSYANSVAALNTEKLFTTQIVNFCNLIFVSQCCVLVHYSVKKSRVNDLIKICISQSDPKNLNFLRRGARWANRAIFALADDSLGYLASEVFVLCGRTVAQYGRFADAGDNGFCHFRKSVSTSGYDDPELEVISTGIYNALGYSKHVWVDDYSAWLQIYRARKIPSPRNAIIGYTITLPRDPLGSGVPKEAEVPLPKLTWVCANTDDT